MERISLRYIHSHANFKMTTSSEVSEPEVSQDTVKRPPVVAFANAGKPDIIGELQSKFTGTGTIGVETIQRCFPYPLDSFQIEAITALVENRSVIVSAPTGSGKTVCGEAAVYLGMALGKKVLYTTPLKALSNQKYSDFCKQFGEERVGLLTGDVSVNRDNATIIVLTTEVYRNMLYDKDSGTVNEVHSVVLDEFHYMNDRDRGTVWEECVIHSPPSILLVALSATMQNVLEIRDWFQFVKGPTTLITSDFRPVPLRFKYVDQKGLVELFDPKPNRKGLPRLNRRLLPASFSDGGEKRSYESGRSRRRSPRGGSDDAGNGKRRRAKGDTDEPGGPPSDRREGGGGKSRFGGVPSYGFVVRQLAKRDMLPAIVFIFSRMGCDKAAEETAAMRGALISAEEKEKLRARLGEFAARHREVAQVEWIRLAHMRNDFISILHIFHNLYLHFIFSLHILKLKHRGVAQVERIRLALQGIASHHAGLVPLWKSFVEELFQDGLIKVVFATETLAAGINMPARTTVITALSKRTSEGVVSLTANELRQMCGRAGRRGKDVVGHSVVMRSRWEGAPEGFALVTRPADPLKSKFSPNYGMVLNLLDQKPLAECRQIVERSFGAFLAMRRRSPTGAVASSSSPAAAEGEPDLDAAAALVGTADPEQLRSYRKALERLKSEERVLSYLRTQAREAENICICIHAYVRPSVRTYTRTRTRKHTHTHGIYRR
jgi:superfamily II RNA helicase